MSPTRRFKPNPNFSRLPTSNVDDFQAYTQDYTVCCKGDDEADVLMDRLTEAANATGVALNKALRQLTQKASLP